MAVFNRISETELREKFTHRGWFCGLVPVYLADIESGCPRIEVCNWVPEFALDLALALFGAFAVMADLAAPGIDLGFPVRITGRLDGLPLLDARGRL